MHLPFILECMTISFHLSKTYKQHPTVFEDKVSLIRTLKYSFELALSIINFIGLPWWCSG